MLSFDTRTLEVLDRAMEVEIETLRPDGMPRMTTIWLIVDRGEVFVRSWKGRPRLLVPGRHRLAR
jgi:hypothetical protein